MAESSPLCAWNKEQPRLSILVTGNIKCGRLPLFLPTAYKTFRNSRVQSPHTEVERVGIPVSLCARRTSGGGASESCIGNLWVFSSESWAGGGVTRRECVWMFNAMERATLFSSPFRIHSFCLFCLDPLSSFPCLFHSLLSFPSLTLKTSSCRIWSSSVTLVFFQLSFFLRV